MLKPQKKLTKKELKEDKFVKTAMETRAFIEDNIKQVSIVTGVVFGLFILIMIYSYVHSQTTEQSFTLLGEAQIEFQNMNYTKAKALLSRLEDEYAGTEASEQGLFLLGNLEYQRGNIEQAAEAYRSFIDSYDGSEILLAAGYAGYAACMEKQGKYEEAAQYYLKAKAAAPKFVEAPNYLYLAALNAIAANKPDQAKNYLQQVTQNYQDSERLFDAKEKLAYLENK